MLRISSHASKYWYNLTMYKVVTGELLTVKEYFNNKYPDSWLITMLKFSLILYFLISNVCDSCVWYVIVYNKHIYTYMTLYITIWYCAPVVHVYKFRTALDSLHFNNYNNKGHGCVIWNLIFFLWKYICFEEH